MATNGHPATPPAQESAAPSAPPATATAPATTAPAPPSPKAQPAPSQTQTLPEVPLTSTQDDGLSKRPRDARLIHLVLSSQGIHSYQERVPLQLLDFAYRYTSGVLSDSLRLSAEGYHNPPAATTSTSNATGGAPAPAASAKAKAAADDSGNITVTALRQAIASRHGYAFQGALPKEFMMQQAAQRNLIGLPKVERGYGVQLPDEKYCLTGVGWGLKEGWESEEDVPVLQEDGGRVAVVESGKEDERMGGMDGGAEDDDDDDDDDEGAGRMEDVFGTDAGGDTSMMED
ncbi:related to TFIID and SAGA subunit [Ramularia collo-cygni]|uniref:Related to TFIID and SAGA subunit n=1 Tax=Ramularia collo-cygni TaxID=112498 RepID=A0A2D3V0I1_9PEZI|nr:related to TFIID and SAGA subunit [Ramularia collo-cygni]CZT15009.1 related to TFIID and SAGA subunit [Ramularia collo-cygni]